MPNESESSRLRRATAALGKAVKAPLTIREKLNAWLLPSAMVLGGIGLTALLGCLLVWLLPAESRPEQLDVSELAFATVVSLLFASLLGWGCMQKGLGRIRRKVGWGIGGWLFVGLPMACATFGLLANNGWIDPEGLGGDPSLLFARGYPPALVAASLLAYVTASTRVGERGRSKRGAYFTLLVAPYALLMAYLVFKFETPWLDDAFEDTIHDLGEGAIVAQVALAYFCGGGSAS